MLHPDDGLEVYFWDDVVGFCARQNGRVMATRNIPYEQAAAIVAVLRGYQAQAIVTCRSTGHSLTVHFNRLFTFQSTFSGAKNYSAIRPEDVSKVTDVIEARLSAPVTGVPLSTEVLQAGLDEAYPQNAATNRRKDEAFIDAMEKTRRLERRRPDVWQSFRDQVIADIRNGTPCAPPITYQLRAKAPDYTAAIFAARFTEEYPEYAVGWGHYRRVPWLPLPPEPSTTQTVQPARKSNRAQGGVSGWATRKG